MPFRAEAAAGNVAEASVTVHLEARIDKPEEHESSAHQKWEASDDDPADNPYWGTAKPNAVVHVVSEHGSKNVTAGADGGWEAKVVFEGAPHGETFKVVVETEGGRAGFTMTVFSADEGEHGFSAHQKYGSCGEEVPYDVFWGTAAPGAMNSVHSEFGSGSTAAEHGEWELEVAFPEAPLGEVFEVQVESSDGGSAEFTFVATGEPPDA